MKTNSKVDNSKDTRPELKKDQLHLHRFLWLGLGALFLVIIGVSGTVYNTHKQPRLTCPAMLYPYYRNPETGETKNFSCAQPPAGWMLVGYDPSVTDPSIPQAPIGAEITFRGEIVELRNDLPVDGNATVTIKYAEHSTAEVIHAQGWNTCKNLAYPNHVWTKGTQVEVFGKVVSNPPLTLSACDDEKYYIL